MLGRRPPGGLQKSRHSGLHRPGDVSRQGVQRKGGCLRRRRRNVLCLEQGIAIPRRELCFHTAQDVSLGYRVREILGVRYGQPAMQGAPPVVALEAAEPEATCRGDARPLLVRGAGRGPQRQHVAGHAGLDAADRRLPTALADDRVAEWRGRGPPGHRRGRPGGDRRRSARLSAASCDEPRGDRCAPYMGGLPRFGHLGERWRRGRQQQRAGDAGHIAWRDAGALDRPLREQRRGGRWHRRGPRRRRLVRSRARRRLGRSLWQRSSTNASACTGAFRAAAGRRRGH
mmetsp:Transcript_19138/g.55526  ORF Transcript_19138/g.55526 Transcript_19138/m.55526 type:complete len:286 (-) Transcript_19138:51-908(-)